MVFNSIEFIIFFFIVAVIFYILPHRYRWIWLLAASCYFYVSTTPYYLLLLSAVVAVEYCIGILIEKNRQKKSGKPKLFLIIGIMFPLAALLIFKYLHFFSETVSQLAQFMNLQYPAPIIEILLPVGISYYTFHAVCYVIEIYRGAQKAETHPGLFSLYILFFPKIISGPIERPQNFIPQLHEEQRLDLSGIVDGLRLMTWGFFKKLVVADRVALLANEVFNNPVSYDGWHFIVASFFFTIQIYADFSGYTDIAIGAARILGFRLMDNFKQPYYSASIGEFWRRWHISLSSWLRDYLYIPLGGNRVVKWRWYYNLFITFLLCGFWHGANWTFILWGVLHGCYLILGNLTAPIRHKLVGLLRLAKAPKLHRVIRIIITFTLVDFAWIFFRANSIFDVQYMITKIFKSLGEFVRAMIRLDLKQVAVFAKVGNDFTVFGFDRKLYSAEMTLSIIGVLFIGIVDFLQKDTGFNAMLSKIGQPQRWFFYIVMVTGILVFGMFTNNQFIYFRF